MLAGEVMSTSPVATRAKTSSRSSSMSPGRGQGRAFRGVLIQFGGIGLPHRVLEIRVGQRPERGVCCHLASRRGGGGASVSDSSRVGRLAPCAIDFCLQASDGRRMVPVGDAQVTAQRLGQLRLAIEAGLQVLRDRDPRPEATIFLLPVTPLRRHHKTRFWHLFWHQKWHQDLVCKGFFYDQGGRMVLRERIELSASPLPRVCSTTELPQRRHGRVSSRKSAQPQGQSGPFLPLALRGGP